MKINNGSRMTDEEIVEIVAKALLARRTHAPMVRVNDETTVDVHNGIHSQWSIHHVMVDVGNIIVWFNRYRQHSPCRSKYIYEVGEPYGFEGLKIDATNYVITVDY